MSESDANFDSFAEFNAEMQSLTDEAEREMSERSAWDPAPERTDFMQMLRPLVLGIEELARSSKELSARLQGVESQIMSQDALPDTLAKVKDAIEHKNYLNQHLFDALHGELKAYRDGLLLEILHKPIILNLISFFDELEVVSRQVSALVEEICEADVGELGSRANTLSTNIKNTLVSLLEVLERIEVSKLDPSTGRHLDKANHRAVGIIFVDSPEQDGEIAESHRPGFTWKGRVVRPEDVTVKKFNNSCLAMTSAEASDS